MEVTRVILVCHLETTGLPCRLKEKRRKFVVVQLKAIEVNIIESYICNEDFVSSIMRGALGVDNSQYFSALLVFHLFVFRF